MRVSRSTATATGSAWWRRTAASSGRTGRRTRPPAEGCPGRRREVLARDGRAPREIFASLPNTLNTPELNLKFPEGEHYKFMEQFLKQARLPDARITTIDGLRADCADGFRLVRASNTTPVLVFRFEADNQAALERIQKQFRALVLAVKPDAQLPF